MARDTVASSTSGAAANRCLLPQARHPDRVAVLPPEIIAVLLAAGSLLLATSEPAAGQGTWMATSTTNAPTVRDLHTAVWTGSKMIIWGGWDGSFTTFVNTGGSYAPAGDTWTTTSTAYAPTARQSHTAVWTGSKMIIWGGTDVGSVSVETGGVYEPATDTWTATSTTNAPTARWGHTAVWTGSKMIVWGGGPVSVNTGGVYDPETDTWTATSMIDAPTRRSGHTAVWTGSKMIVWGGEYFGGVYDPVTDTWTAVSSLGAPTVRAAHTAIWTGSKMIVWGGWDFGNFPVNTGGVYDPATDTWTAVSTTDAPMARTHHTAVWTGSKMIVWGGGDQTGTLMNTGGVYDPATDTWTATAMTDAPSVRENHTAVWTGSKMVVWGGWGASGIVNSGGVYGVPVPSHLFTVTPCRVFDTREPSGPTLGAPLTCGTVRNFAVAGKCGVPSSATAISLIITGTASTAQGNLRLYPAGAATPLVSTLNYVAGISRANNAVAALGVDGQISVLCSPSGATHVVLDVNGYFE